MWRRHQVVTSSTPLVTNFYVLNFANDTLFVLTDWLWPFEGNCWWICRFALSCWQFMAPRSGPLWHDGFGATPTWHNQWRTCSVSFGHCLTVMCLTTPTCWGQVARLAVIEQFYQIHLRLNVWKFRLLNHTCLLLIYCFCENYIM